MGRVSKTAPEPTHTVPKTAADKSRPGGESTPEKGNSPSLATSEEMVACQAPGRTGPPVYLEKWRYDLLRRAILNVLPADEIGLMYKQLIPAVRSNLSKQDRQRIGGLHHDATLVKLDLEFRGEVERIEGMRPQYLRRVEKPLKKAAKKTPLIKNSRK